MTALLTSETRKLRSTRTGCLLALAVVVLAGLSALSTAGQSAAEYARPLGEQQFLFLTTFTRLFVVVLGVRMVTDEYRYGTIVPTLLVSPARHRTILAKVVVGGIAGLLVGAAGQLAALAGAAAVFSAHHHPLPLGAPAAAVVLAGGAAGALWAVIGVAVGAVVRNQVVATVGPVVWLLLLEQMVQPRLGHLAWALPGQAGSALALDLAPTHSGTTLLAYAAVGTALGVLVTRGRDIA